MLVDAVGAERLHDGEDVVRRPGDDERQQDGAQGLGRLLFLPPLLPPLPRPQRAAALGRSRRDARLHAEHHRLGGLRQPAADQRAERRRPRNPGRRRQVRAAGLGRPPVRAAGGAPSPVAAGVRGAARPTRDRVAGEVRRRRGSSTYSHFTRRRVVVSRSNRVSLLTLSRCSKRPQTTSHHFLSSLQDIGTVKSTVKENIKERLYQSSYLISSHLILFHLLTECAVIDRSLGEVVHVLRTDPIHPGFDQS